MSSISITKLTLYVRNKDGETVDKFEHEVKVLIRRLHEIINFGGYVEYSLDYFLNAKPDQEWFCLDFHGRNYGREPHGVHVRVEDVLAWLKQIGHNDVSKGAINGSEG